MFSAFMISYHEAFSLMLKYLIKIIIAKSNDLWLMCGTKCFLSKMSKANKSCTVIFASYVIAYLCFVASMGVHLVILSDFLYISRLQECTSLDPFVIKLM